jgi:hypothetical protein
VEELTVDFVALSELLPSDTEWSMELVADAELVPVAGLELVVELAVRVQLVVHREAEPVLRVLFTVGGKGLGLFGLMG